MSQFLIPVTHRHFDEIDSTNTQLIHAVSNGVLERNLHHLYTANYQTAGRGQHDRNWVSAKGNVFLSLYIPLAAGEYTLNQLSGLLSLAVGLELSDLPVIRQVNERRSAQHLPKIGVKWANDVGFYAPASALFNKLAGILIEPVFTKKAHSNVLVGAVVGVGLNVAHAPSINDSLYQAACINELVEASLDADALYIPISNAILTAVRTCNHCQAQAALDDFISRFDANHVLQGKQVAVFLQTNSGDAHAQGECIGIGKQGELRLQMGEHVSPIFAGMTQLKLRTTP